MEFAILDFIQTNMRTVFLDYVMPLISILGNKGAIWLLTAAVLCLIPAYRKSGAVVFISLAIGFILCNLTIKPLAARMRPFDIIGKTDLLIAAPNDYSFPSGHTTAAFTASFALCFAKNRLWIPAMILASLMAFSRMYLYVHFPTDILGGIALGICSGFLGAKLCSFAAKKLSV